jgi:hypothetical protein
MIPEEEREETRLREFCVLIAKDIVVSKLQTGQTFTEIAQEVYDWIAKKS